MKKHLSLVVSFILFSASLALAQERSGLGFEYGGGYLMPLNDYDMRSVQSFALTMDLSEDLSAAIFRSDGMVRGENSYSVGDTDYKLVNTADISITGLRFKHALPGDLPLSAGMEMGTARFTDSNHITDAIADFGGADDLDGSHPVLGLLVDAELISTNTDTISASVNAGAAFRIIALPDTYSLGTEEAQDPDQNEIEAVKSFNNLSFTVGLNIGF